MKFRDLYILAASIGFVVSACAGKEFSSASARSEVGGQSEALTGIGGQSGTGGQPSASGGDSSGGSENGGTENRVSSSISSTSAEGGAANMGGAQNLGGAGVSGGGQASGGIVGTGGSTIGAGTGGATYTGGTPNVGGTAATGGVTFGTHTGGNGEPSSGGAIATGGSTTQAHMRSGGTNAAGGRFTRPHSGGSAQTGGVASTGGTESTGTTAVIPAGWSCGSEHYGTNDGCDCGCGVLDPDCGGYSAASACVSASDVGSCGRAVGWGVFAIDSNDNTRCISLPAGWKCLPAYYGDGDCHCGCGAKDIDCADAGVGACKQCNTTGSCAAFDDCPAIDPTDNSKCIDRPTVPALWTCSPAFYGTGDGCDCGCGVHDPDCGSSLKTECHACDDAGSCSAFGGCALIMPSDNANCVAGEWRCDPSWFGASDGCDCGCGAVDPDCRSTLGDACLSCVSLGSCAETCADISAENNALCTTAR